jgi:hypothetical protein
MLTPVPAPRLLLALILGVTLLNACGKEDPASLVAEARSMLATGNYKGAMIQLKTPWIRMKQTPRRATN